MLKFIRNKKRMIIILTSILFICSVYLFGLVFYSSHFLPKTSINGIDVSSMNLDKANEAIRDLKPQITVIQKTNGKDTDRIFFKSR